MKRKIISLKENHMFSKTYSKGKCEVSRLCAVYVMRNFRKNPDGSFSTKLGITVNRKLGSACRRNRVKRIIREAYKNSLVLIPDGFIIVIAARAAAFSPNVKSPDMEKCIRACLTKIDFDSLNKNPRKN